MTIGLSKSEIVSKLMENKEWLSDENLPGSLFDKIAEVITENNKKIEKEISNIAAQGFLDAAKRRGIR